MKTLKFTIAVLLVSVALFSCSSNDDGNSNLSCDEAIAATSSASQAFDAATDENRESLCNAYKNALQNQIDECGDENGGLQDLIDALGDCTIPGSISIMTGDTRMYYYDVTVTVVGNIRQVRAERAGGDQWISFEVATGATGTTVINNFVFHMLNRDYTPMTEDNIFGTWMTDITVNNSAKITGTFSGPVVENDGDDIQNVIVLYEGQIEVFL